MNNYLHVLVTTIGQIMLQFVVGVVMLSALCYSLCTSRMEDGHVIDSLGFAISIIMSVILLLALVVHSVITAPQNNVYPVKISQKYIEKHTEHLYGVLFSLRTKPKTNNVEITRVQKQLGDLVSMSNNNELSSYLKRG